MSDQSINPFFSKKESDSENEIEELFKFNRINFLRDKIVGDSSSDFFVETPNGGTIVFEVKSWDASPNNISRAQHYAHLMSSASRVDNAFVVLPKLTSDVNESNVISPSDVLEKINENSSTHPKSEKPEIREKPSRKVFTAMPFEKIYDDTYLVAIQPAVISANLDCIRVDEEPNTGDIVARIKRLIEESILLIADVSESKPNVLYEMGYAEGLQHKTIQISSTPLDQLPFDIRNNMTIQYSIGQTHSLRDEIAKTLRTILST